MTETVSTESPKRYHPIFVVFHWAAALLIIFVLVSVKGLRGIPTDGLQRAMALKNHAFIGAVAVGLLAFRFLLRFIFKRPADANTGDSFMEFAAKWAHVLLYVLAIAVVVAGYFVSQSAGLPDVFSGAAPYPSFRELRLSSLSAHKMLANIVSLLVFLHVGAVGYHQFSLKDNLISRMWFGKR